MRREYRVYPPEEVSALLRQHPAALLLIEKQDHPGCKPLPLSCGDGVRGVGPAERRRILAGKLGIQPPVEEDHEAETISLEDGAFAYPAIALVAGRVVQPIAGIGKAAVQRRQQVVAGILISVEAEVGLVGGLPQSRHPAQDRQAQQGRYAKRWS